MKDQVEGGRVPCRGSPAFLPQAEQQVTSNREKLNFLGKAWEGSEPRTA